MKIERFEDIDPSASQARRAGCTEVQSELYVALDEEYIMKNAK
jgi:hypothetical protein